MDIKYQIFISSTFADLEDERRAVMEAILNLRHIPVGMELFHATDESQWDYIQRRIAECDYYIVIVGERYGSEVGGKSYTQKEYELAVALEIPVIAFLLHEDARQLLPAIKVEFEKKLQIDAFREICKQRLVKFWKNSDDLALKVTQSLGGIFEDMPRTGWVRSDRVPSWKVVEELSRLSEEKRHLQSAVDELEAKSNPPIPADVKYRITQLAEMQLLDSKYCMLDVFLLCKNFLANGCRYFEIQHQVKDNWGLSITSGFSMMIAAEFATRNLVRVTTSDDNFGSQKYYSLSEYGANFIMYAEKWLTERASGIETHPF